MIRQLCAKGGEQRSTRGLNRRRARQVSRRALEAAPFYEQMPYAKNLRREPFQRGVSNSVRNPSIHPRRAITLE